MHALDASQNGGDVAVLTIEGEATLLIVPTKARETPLNGADGQGRGPVIRRGTVGNVEANQFRRRGQGISTTPTTPAGIMRPVSFVGRIGVFGRCLAGILFGGINQAIKACLIPRIERAK